MARSTTRGSASIWLLVLAALFLVITFVVLVSARVAFIDATRWVQHTNEVKLAIARARIALDEGDRPGAVASIGEVRALTRDNPRQQARLARFDIGAPDVRLALDQLAEEEETLLAVRAGDEKHKREAVGIVLAVCALLSVGLVTASILLARRDQQALARHTALLGSILESIGDSVVAVDRDNRFLITNGTFRRIFGKGLEHGRLAVHAEQRQQAQKADGSPMTLEEGPLGRALAGESVDGLVMSLALSEPGRDRIWLSACSRPVLDEEHAVRAAVAVLRDVTRERSDRALLERQAEELRVQSLVDDLTGLYNRRGFLLLADQYARAALRSSRPFAVMFADLDGLKAINDGHGHDEGDRAIRRMAGILKTTLRESDIVARLGGDEFVALLDGADEMVVASVMARLQHEVTVEEAREAKPYRLSVSTGSAFQGAGGSTTIETLITQADERMYSQKMSSRSAG